MVNHMTLIARKSDSYLGIVPDANLLLYNILSQQVLGTSGTSLLTPPSPTETVPTTLQQR
jgi:hypothetical protein